MLYQNVAVQLNQALKAPFDGMFLLRPYYAGFEVLPGIAVLQTGL